MKKFIFIISIALIGLDQYVKYIVINSLEMLKSIKIINNFFYLTYVENDGAAFSIFSGYKWFFIIIALLAIAILIKYIIMDKKIYKIDVLAYSLVLSGIIGNLIDRIYVGRVIDYLDFYIFGYDFAIFNLADTFLVIGAFLILYNLIVKGDSNEKINS